MVLSSLYDLKSPKEHCSRAGHYAFSAALSGVNLPQALGLCQHGKIHPARKQACLVLQMETLA